jgi:hypothetical protein
MRSYGEFHNALILYLKKQYKLHNEYINKTLTSINKILYLIRHKYLSKQLFFSTLKIILSESDIFHSGPNSNSNLIIYE